MHFLLVRRKQKEKKHKEIWFYFIVFRFFFILLLLLLLFFSEFCSSIFTVWKIFEREPNDLIREKGPFKFTKKQKNTKYK